MEIKRFWNWIETNNEDVRTLFMDGTIAEDSWFEDDVTPHVFRQELQAGSGDIILWINSPGGDVIAGAQIYNMLIDYPGKVTVKIDGIAASAASVIVMAGDAIYMSPVSMLMIHNPMTIAIGDSTEMEKAIDMLASFKASIINAYETKTKLPRKELSQLMDAETWMDVHKAMELGFCDGVLEKVERSTKLPSTSMMFSRKAVTNSLLTKVKESRSVHASHLESRLKSLKNNWRNEDVKTID